MKLFLLHFSPFCSQILVLQFKAFSRNHNILFGDIKSSLNCCISFSFCLAICSGDDESLITWMSGLFSFCFIFVTVLKRRWKHSSAFLWTEPEVWGVCEKEQIASYSSVTRSDLVFFFTQVLYFGGWGNEEGAWCVISYFDSLCPNFPVLFPFSSTSYFPRMALYYLNLPLCLQC